jgi:flagellar hook-basal body complex protein FliE
MINPIAGLGLFTSQTDGPSADNTVSKALINSVKGGEAMSFAGIQGKSNTREVVDAVLQAEQTLKTATAFRDKIVSAYLDITKMQI